VLRRVGVLLVLVVLSGASAGAGSAGPNESASAVYGGLGSWLDIYASRSSWDPHVVIARAENAGVQTLYLQTSNYSRHEDVVRPAALGRLIDSAHAAGMSVVGWYLPSFANPRQDAHRALAAVRFHTASGQRFDGFALDIEASVVAKVAERNARLLSLARLLRHSVPSTYPLGAIIPSPVGIRRHPRYWPQFPYAALARVFDAFLPMAYFSYYANTPQSAYAYARDVVTTLRARLGPWAGLIHMIGGSAKSIPAATLAGFVRAVSDCGLQGVSLYAFPQTSAADWAALDAVSLAGDVTPSCAPR
jgi:hypothetical protein